MAASLLSTGCMSPLHNASAHGNIRKINKLLNEGHDINAGTFWYNYAPIYSALHNKQPEAIKLLIERGAEMKTGGWTPLHDAAKHSDSDIIQMMINAGAEVNAKESDGRTPLHIAAEWQNIEAARTLLDAGADPDILSFAGLRPIDYALKSVGDNKKEMVDLLKIKTNARNKASGATQSSPPEPIVIPQMNTPE